MIVCLLVTQEFFNTLYFFFFFLNDPATPEISTLPLHDALPILLIYFSEQRRRALFQSFYKTLEPGGYLFLGHSKSISKLPVKFQAIVLNDCFLYRKPAADALLKPELVTEGRA